MKNTNAVAANKSLNTRRVQSGPGLPLDRRYGAIGISAVAAAARYQGNAKNPAYAPVTQRVEQEAEVGV